MKRLTRTIKEIRVEHNRELIQRMNSGDNMQSFDSFSSWFPPRPVIQKDLSIVKKLYSKTAADTATKTPENLEQVVAIVKTAAQDEAPRKTDKDR